MVMNKILITPKINPDLDGVACAYAYAQLLNIIDSQNQYIAGIYGEPQSEARFLLAKYNINEGLLFSPKIEFDKFIIVDASDIKGMPEIIRPQDVIEVIDHRAVHQAEKLFVNAKIQVEPVGAAATLIFEKLKAAKLAIKPESAHLLLGAIFSNTLNFKSDIVSTRDVFAKEFLIKDCHELIPMNFINEMFSYKTEYIINNLEKTITDDFKIFDNHLGVAQLEGFNLEKVVNIKVKEIKEILQKIVKTNNLEYVFLTVADIKNGYNIFVAIDEKTKIILNKSMGLSFNNNGIAKNNKLFLRKQILPLLVDYL
jgi:manganese-dependent inorganic pyrophosphatase